MTRNRRSGFVRSADDTVERGCPHCEWYVVVGSYPEMVKQYQDHLRTSHPKAWVRS